MRSWRPIFSEFERARVILTPFHTGGSSSITSCSRAPERLRVRQVPLSFPGLASDPHFGLERLRNVGADNNASAQALVGLALFLAVGVTSSRPSNRKRGVLCEESVAESPEDVKLLTYNVLAPQLAPPDHFPTCSPEDLTKDVRLPKILARLRQAALDGAVIGLQEVDLEWCGKLHVFFEENDYAVVFAQYGKQFNGYMGVMLAWPRQKYEVLDVQINRVSDIAPTTVWPKEKGASSSSLTPHGMHTWKGMKEILGCPPPDFSINDNVEWSLARERVNEVIMARLRLRGESGDCERRREFCVATYHMPCFFGSIEKIRVVNIHCQLLMARLADFANGDPAALMGDFNFNPKGSSYSLMMAGGALDEVRTDWPAELKGLERLPFGVPVPGGLRSAYQAFHGQEPPFTNFALSSMNEGAAFVDTLDYIWFSPKTFQVTACPILPQIHGFAGPLPSVAEPSDHLPLRATLRMCHV